eukprot:TRINITY_DN18549_c0_g1_i1.p1 TRINITY_DN18549_c0_g1~~TRINITY_DN18549_c0_g1_i1.p1  ORF type:complete len:437 (-),score=121.12 TRINITY_DN18549_c0_g1_i1:154-1464(-)
MAGDKAPELQGAAATVNNECLDLEALQGRIMTEIQNKLAKKEESLWRRGQVEIQRLQSEQRDVVATMSHMQEQQAVLVSQNQEMRRTLVEVTSKFEQVVKQMREVFRTLPAAQQAALEASVPETSAAFEAAAAPGNTSAAMHGSLTTWPSGSTASGGKQSARESVLTPLATSIDSEKTFLTPPRGTAVNDPYAALCAPVPALPTTWSSASTCPTPLSLASALPTSTSMAATPSPSPATRLNLSEWLPDQGSFAAGAGANQAMPPLPTSQRAQPVKQMMSVELVKDPGFTTLGVEVKQEDGSLRVEVIDEHGLVGHFNSQQEASGKAGRILVGDQIIEVNGVKHDPELMLQACKADQRLTMRISRTSQAEETSDAAPAELPQTSSPNLKLRPDAEVFVPSSQKAQKEQVIAAPPGLEGVKATPAGAEDTDVKRALFH